MDFSIFIIITAGLLLMKNIFTSLAKSVLIPLGASDAAIPKKIYGLGTTTLIILNEEMKDITKTVKSLEESRLLIKGISESIKSEEKEQKGRFFPMLLGNIATSLLGNALAGKGVKKVDEGIIRAVQYF